MINELNSQQKKAVMELDGVVRVLAGAGTGKTKVLVSRYLNLLKTKNISPDSILNITFTNKAAKEMLVRIKKEIPDISNHWITTFHGACFRILMETNNNIPPEIVDEYNSRKIIKKIIKEYDIEIDLTPQKISKIFSRAKDDGYYPENFSYQENKDVDLIYKKYQEYLEKNDLLDFGDLICKTIFLLESNEKILKKYQNKFKYIQIDEYQDTNGMQHRLIVLIGKSSENIFLVGDPYQCIYEWRGARMENMDLFESDFPNLKTILLEKNYRSKQNILDFSNTLMKYSVNTKNKNLWTDSKDGEKVFIMDGVNSQNQICNEINKLITSGYKGNEIAVLFRANRTCHSLERNFLQNKIPYISNGTPLYKKREFKDVVCYLKILLNENDTLSIEEVINTPRRGISTKSLKIINDYMQKNGLSYFNALRKCEKIEGLSQKAKEGINKFVDMFNEIWDVNVLDTKEDVINGFNDLLNESGIIDYWADKEIKDSSKGKTTNYLRNIETIKETIELAKDKNEILEILALNSDSTIEEGSTTEKVFLSTIHKAKGLEWKVVFVVSFYEKFMKDKRVDRQEEERRIYYVAFTRAKELLYVLSESNSPLDEFMGDLKRDLKDDTIKFVL